MMSFTHVDFPLIRFAMKTTIELSLIFEGLNFFKCRFIGSLLCLNIFILKVLRTFIFYVRIIFFSVHILLNSLYLSHFKMGGGLMQLVAYGAQDVFLTGNPQISFFKVLFRRHTNFAMESIEQTFNGNPELGNRVTCTISRNGDLVTNMWLEVKFADTANVVNSLGHALIEYVELEIGGQRIDKHYGEWLEIWSELTLPEEKRNGFKEMIGRRDAGVDYAPESNKLYIPFQFFFCRNPGLALPLIALQYHEVKLNIKFRSASELIKSGAVNGAFKFEGNPRLFVDYVYLDTDERRRFAQSQHEYLIEQLQHTGPESTKDDNHRLNFNHPVKELVWVARRDNADPLEFAGKSNSTLGAGSTYNADYAWSTPDGEAFNTAKLQLNGHDRFTERDSSYFRLVQPYQHHTRVPSKYIYLYSFALNPESNQPSGTCNFSRLDNVTLSLGGLKNKVGDNGQLLVYAVSNNVLRIMSGMGGLAYSN